MGNETVSTPQKRGPKSKKEQESFVDTKMEQKILENAEAESFVDPLTIINQATGGGHARVDDEDINKKYGNVIEDTNLGVSEVEEDILGSGASKGVAPIALDELDKIAESAMPTIRKVVVRKIVKTNFRLGLEKQKEKFNMFPGTSHTFACDKVGDEFKTGFDIRDDKGNLVYEKDRKRLERILRKDLGPASLFWANLSFRLEDKQHGVILNFDDPKLGAYNEAVYFGLIGSSIVANGMQEYISGKKPAAEWYIENKEAEAEIRQKEIDVEQRALEAYGKCSEVKRRGIGKLLGLAVWGASNRIVNSLLWDYLKGINSTGEGKVNSTKNCETFLKLYEQGEIEFQTRVIIRDAIKLNVLRKNRLKEYVFGDINLGPSEDSAVARLVLPQNGNILRSIKAVIEQKQ